MTSIYDLLKKHQLVHGLENDSKYMNSFITELQEAMEGVINDSYTHCEDEPCAKTNCNFNYWTKEQQRNQLNRFFGKEQA